MCEQKLYENIKRVRVYICSSVHTYFSTQQINVCTGNRCLHTWIQQYRGFEIYRCIFNIMWQGLSVLHQTINILILLSTQLILVEVGVGQKFSVTLNIINPFQSKVENISRKLPNVKSVKMISITTPGAENKTYLSKG